MSDSSPIRGPREHQLREGIRRLTLALAALRLIDPLGEGLSQRAAARRLGVSAKDLCAWLRMVRENPAATAEDLAPRSHLAGRRPTEGVLSTAEVKAIRVRVAKTNRTEESGSWRQAVRDAIAAGELRPDIVSLIQLRDSLGQEWLPEAQLRRLRIARWTIRATRQPRNTWLDTVSSAGALRTHHEPGAERLLRAGEQLTIDDGSINLVCVVPGLPRRGDRCYDKFGVAVGRFQFLLVTDQASDFVCGWSYTARPRDSYRAEDVLATLQNTFAEHGIPDQLMLEHGVFAARSISEMCGLAGIQLHRADSPHQKAVESVFNRLWTILSVLPGQVGRSRGEEEATSRLFESCKRGETDPRKHFLALPDVLQGIRAAIAQHNADWVKSDIYGRWKPAELWEREAQLRPLSPDDAWMFSPTVAGPLKVRSFSLKTSVQMAPGMSLQFHFGAPWLVDYAGAPVRLHFNPFATDAVATAVLAEDWQHHRAGTVLGTMTQYNLVTRISRRALGYGLDPDIGLTEIRSHAQALRRSVVAVRADGQQGRQTHESRNGTGRTTRLEVGEANSADTTPRRDRGVAVSAPSDERNRAANDPRLQEFLDEDEPVLG